MIRGVVGSRRLSILALPSPLCSNVLLLLAQDCGMGVIRSAILHHQNSKNQPLSVGFFSPIPASAGADSGHDLASASHPNPEFSPRRTPLCSPFSLLVSRACASSLPLLARAFGWLWLATPVAVATHYESIETHSYPCYSFARG